MGAISTAPRRPKAGQNGRLWIDPQTGNVWRDDVTDWAILKSGGTGPVYGPDLVPDPEFASGTIIPWAKIDDQDDVLEVVNDDTNLTVYRESQNTWVLGWEPACSSAIGANWPADIKAGHTYELQIAIGGQADGFILLGDSEDMNDSNGQLRVSADPFLYTCRWVPDDDFSTVAVVVVGETNATVYYCQIREVLSNGFPIAGMNLNNGFPDVCGMESVPSATGGEGDQNVINQLRTALLQLGVIINGDG